MVTRPPRPCPPPPAPTLTPPLRCCPPTFLRCRTTLARMTPERRRSSSAGSRTRRRTASSPSSPPAPTWTRIGWTGYIGDPGKWARSLGRHQADRRAARAARPTSAGTATGSRCTPPLPASRRKRTMTKRASKVRKV